LSDINPSPDGIQLQQTRPCERRIAGVVLVGADLLRLRVAARTGAPAPSLGGAGTRDGIFLTGVTAVLFA